MLEMLLPGYTKQLLENYQSIYAQLASQMRWLHFDDSFRLMTRVGYLDDGYIRLRLDGHWEFTGELLREMSWMFYSIGEMGRNIDELGKLVLVGYTTTPLAANASWTSAVDSDPATGRIVGSVYANQAGTLYIEQSPDGANWDVVDSFSISAGAGIGFSVEKVCPYTRVRYVNGATAQTVFRLYVYKRLRVI